MDVKIEVKILKTIAKKIFKHVGYQISISKHNEKYNNLPVELNNYECELIKFVYENQFTMTSIPRLVNTLKSCKYVVENNIPGDFVECGVWRGGNGILARKYFDHVGSKKKVWMFDTFEGMTEPGIHDKKHGFNILAKIKYDKSLNENYVDWCYASLEDVKNNCIKSNINLNDVCFVKGDICKILLSKKNLPDRISVLRLDTDFYESTKSELEILYPLLSKTGVLIIDDYGGWEGSKKACDEYFIKMKEKIFLQVIDKTGRSGIKI